MATTCETKNCCLAGAGRIYLRPFNECCDPADEQAYIGLGNCSSFTVDANVSELKVQDYTNVGGGTECQTSWIDSATARITGLCFTADNFAKCWSGDIAAKAAAIKTLTLVARGKDSFIPFLDSDGNPITDVDVSSVTIAAFGVKGYDYVVTPNGVIIPELSTLSGFPVTASGVSVTHGAYNIVDMLTSAAKEFTLFYSGVNRFGNKPFSVTLYRVKLKPVSGIPLIGTDAASAEYMMELLKDNCRPEGNGFSQYGTLAI
jgi:hypothetical protein